MRSLSSIFVSLILSSPVAAAVPTPEKELVPELVASEAAATWDGPQIVRADRVGNVFFLRADTLEVYPLDRSGKLGEPAKLEVMGEAPQLVREAALSPGGEAWLISADLGIRRFVDGKEKAMPALEWRPSGIGFQRGDPIVSLLPLAVSSDQVLRERKGQIPYLMIFDGDRWNNLAEYADSSAAGYADRRPDLNGAIAQHATFVATDSQGRIWVARQYAYDIEQLASSGKQRVHLVVNGGKVTERKEVAEDKERPAGLTAFRSQAAILDLVEGRDRKVYFLVAGDGTGDGLLLDRYDPVTSDLQTVRLALKQSGRLTLAAGRNGLYLAAWNGRGGRWLISWDALEFATWKPVPKAEISPSPLPEPEPVPPTTGN